MQYCKKVSLTEKKRNKIKVLLQEILRIVVKRLTQVKIVPLYVKLVVDVSILFVNSSSKERKGIVWVGKKTRSRCAKNRLYTNCPKKDL